MIWPVRNSDYLKFNELIFNFARFMRIRLECVKLSSMHCFLNKQLLLIIIMVYIALFVLTAELIHSGPNDSRTI